MVKFRLKLVEAESCLLEKSKVRPEKLEGMVLVILRPEDTSEYEYSKSDVLVRILAEADVGASE